MNRASLACGPMVKWAIAQLNYADMLKRVEPLRMELKSLEQAAAVKQKEADEMAATITRLEKSINSYKEEYAQLISQAEAIKTDLKQVQVRILDAIAAYGLSLLPKLSKEHGSTWIACFHKKHHLALKVGSGIMFYRCLVTCHVTWCSSMH